MVIVLSLHGVEWSDLDEVEECLPVLDDAHNTCHLNLIYFYNQSFILVKNNVNTKGGILTTMKLSRSAT